MRAVARARRGVASARRAVARAVRGVARARRGVARALRSVASASHPSRARLSPCTKSKPSIPKPQRPHAGQYANKKRAENSPPFQPTLRLVRMHFFNPAEYVVHDNVKVLDCSFICEHTVLIELRVDCTDVDFVAW